MLLHLRACLPQGIPVALRSPRTLIAGKAPLPASHTRHARAHLTRVRPPRIDMRSAWIVAGLVVLIAAGAAVAARRP
ncbi:MAG TPA: hypothetical protein VF832_01430, partial [Longimicrobiales bacterium]